MKTTLLAWAAKAVWGIAILAYGRGATTHIRNLVVAAMDLDLSGTEKRKRVRESFRAFLSALGQATAEWTNERINALIEDALRVELETAKAKTKS